MKVKSESEVAQSYPTLSDPVDCSLPGSSVHGIFQARVLEWGPLPSPPIPLGETKTPKKKKKGFGKKFRKENIERLRKVLSFVRK